MNRLVRGIWGAVFCSAVVVVVTSSGIRAADGSGLQRVERLVVHYHAGNFELVSRTNVKKVIPPTLSFADSTVEHSGSWFELQTGTGMVLYRRLIPRPETVYFEMTDTTSGRIVRQEGTVSDRTIVVIVPLRDDATQVVFYGQPAGAVGKMGATQALGSIRLR